MGTFLFQLTLLSFIRLLCDLILPESDTARYADLGISLWLLLCILQNVQLFLEAWQR